MAKKRKKTGVKEKSKESNEMLLKKRQTESQSKILKGFLIGMAVLLIFIVLFVYGIKLTKKFQYEGVNFEIVKTGNLVLYNTKLPLVVDGKKAEYNFYLRNDPRKIGEDVPFNGTLIMKSNMVVNVSSSLNCDGDGIIGLANVVGLYKVIGTNVIRDENASCDPAGRYVYLNILEGNETSVEQVGSACYNININNCEILKGTERFMVESLVKVNEIIS